MFDYEASSKIISLIQLSRMFCTNFEILFALVSEVYKQSQFNVEPILS